MTRFVLILLAMMVSCSIALAAGEPFARILVRGDQPVLAGQQVPVDVQVFAPNFFMSAPDFPLFDVPGAIVTMPDDTGINLTEALDSVSYSGIQKSYVVTPLVGGEIVFPPVEIAFKYAAEPGKPTDGKVTLPQEKIRVTVPAGAVGPDGPVPLARLSVSQSLDRDVHGLEAGDALVRSVDIKAQGMPSMMIPPPTFTAPDGVRIYRKDPRLSDGSSSGRGFEEGERLETVTYVFEKPGDFTLPALTMNWFDATANRIETAKADEIKVTVAAAPAPPAIAPEQPADDIAPPQEPGRWKWWLAGGAAVLLLAAVVAMLVRRYAPRVSGWLEARRGQRAESESAYFQGVRDAFATGDPMAAYRAVDRWMRRIGFTSVMHGAAVAGDPRLQADVAQLEKSIFGADRETAPLNGGEFLQRLSAMRTSLIKSRKSAPAAAALPPLNPEFSVRTGR